MNQAVYLKVSSGTHAYNLKSLGVPSGATNFVQTLSFSEQFIQKWHMEATGGRKMEHSFMIERVRPEEI
jgi:hypothetical protein